MVVKKCEYCGKAFPTISGSSKFCCRTCKTAFRKAKQDEESQLCWLCKNATGNCSWSKSLKPVDGWGATPVVTKDKEGSIRTYDIKSCPKFIRG